MNTDRIDAAVLALLYLGRWGERDHLVRSWKAFDWDAMDRLHEKGLISDPATKARSVIMTEQGLCQVKEAFEELFGTIEHDDTD